MWALHCGTQASLVAACGLLSSCGAQDPECAFSVVVARGLCCPMAGGILVPRPGIEPTFPALEGGFLNTGPPGKSPCLLFLTSYFTSFCFVYPLTTYCGYRWFYYFCLLTLYCFINGWSTTFTVYLLLPLRFFPFVIFMFPAVSFSFLCREVPLTLLVKLVWWCWTLLAFACL